MDKEKKKIILVALIVVFAILFIGAVSYLVLTHMSCSGQPQKIQESFASELTVGTTNAEGLYPENPTMKKIEDSTDSTGSGSNDKNPVDFESLRAQNSDVYSWIFIPDTNISYPVLQSDVDDNFYLDHDVYKNYSFPGAIYSQSMNSKDYSDRVTVLYGHNMLNGSMFANLHYFSDKSFFDSHPYFYVYTENRKLTYQVVSAYDYDDRHIMNSYNFKDDGVFNGWLSSITAPHSLNSNVRSDVKLDLNSKLLVLSTCLNAGDGRFLVQGVLIKDEKTK